jgi:hypothetical protein
MDQAAVLERINQSIAQREDLEIAAARQSRGALGRYVFGWHQAPIHKAMQWYMRKYRRLVMDAPTEHGKTSQTQVLDVLARLGEHPTEMMMLFSSTREKPLGNLKVVVANIEYNEKLHRVYPNLKVEKWSEWEGKLTVRRGDETGLSQQTNPSVVACGFDSDIYGKRLTHIASDDMCHAKNSWTRASRDKLWTIFKQECLRRLAQYNPRTGIGDSHVDTGTPFHVDDPRHKLRELPIYKFVRFEADAQELWPEVVEVDGIRWGGFTRERYRTIRDEELGQLEYDRQYNCKPYSGNLSVFRTTDLESAKVAGRGQWAHWKVERPAGYISAYRPLPERGIPVGCGIDLGAGGDDTALAVAGVLHGKWIPLKLVKGLIPSPLLASIILETLRQFPGVVFTVESNSTQKLVRQIFNDDDYMRAKGATDQELPDLYCNAWNTTGQKKRDPMHGIMAMARVFESKKWEIPTDTGLADHEPISTLLRDMRDWTPEDTHHTGDGLIALWLAVESVRGFRSQSGDMWSDFGLYAGGGE